MGNKECDHMIGVEAYRDWSDVWIEEQLLSEFHHINDFRDAGGNRPYKLTFRYCPLCGAKLERGNNGN